MLLLRLLLLCFPTCSTSRKVVGAKSNIAKENSWQHVAKGKAMVGGGRWAGSAGRKMGASAVPKKNIIKSNQSEDADAATAHESKIN